MDKSFFVHDHLIYYVDYEVNEYTDEWNFENWGVKCWSRTPEFEAYLKKYMEGGREHEAEEIARQPDRVQSGVAC